MAKTFIFYGWKGVKSGSYDILPSSRRITPRKINMEPENIPLEKEKSSSKPSFSGSMLIFGGVQESKCLKQSHEPTGERRHFFCVGNDELRQQT